jgi:hypothetical protein
VLLLSGTWYLLAAHKHYKGPMGRPSPATDTVKNRDGDAEGYGESGSDTPSDQKDTEKEGLSGPEELVKEV